jgi:hypothetical protein
VKLRVKFAISRFPQDAPFFQKEICDLGRIDDCLQRDRDSGLQPGGLSKRRRVTDLGLSQLPLDSRPTVEDKTLTVLRDSRCNRYLGVVAIWSAVDAVR